MTAAASAAGPPLDLTRSQASRAAARELSRGIYGRTSWTRELGRAALALLGRLFAAAPGHSGPVGVLVLLAVVIVAAAVVLGLVRVGVPRRNARHVARLTDTPAPRTAAELRARAVAAADAGDWTTAVLAGFRALAEELVGAGAVPAATGAPGLTAAELVEAAAPALPAAAVELRAAAVVFGAISYGYRRAGSADSATVTAADLAVRGALAGVRSGVRSGPGQGPGQGSGRETHPRARPSRRARRGGAAARGGRRGARRVGWSRVVRDR